MADEDKVSRLAKWLHDHLTAYFTVMFQAVWSGFTDLITPVWDLTYNFWREKIGKVETDQWNDMLDAFINAGMLAKEHKDDLLKIKDTWPVFDWLMYFNMTFGLVKTWIDTTLYYSSAEMRHNLASTYTPELPRPEEILQAAFVAPEKTQEVRDTLKKFGLPDEAIDLLFLARYRLYNEETIRTLWLRGVLSDDEMYMRMRELGYTDTRIKEIAQSWPLIPGPSDLFHLVAKEAFEPDAIAEMGLEAEFPEEQVKWLKQQGLSEYWARKYWIAHWEQPSIQMGFEMLHRGVINHDQLDTLFRTTEIPPYWRDKLTAIAYAPYTRVDVRRMHAMGVIDDDELIKSYMDLGYDLEHATKMAEFTKAYNRGTEKNLTKSQIITAYNDKLISRQDAIELLGDLNYSQDVAEFILVSEDYKQAKELQDDMIDNIRDRYQNNLIDFAEARRLLDELNLPAERSKLLLDKWQIKRYTDRKLPSRGDLSKMLQQGIITEDDFRVEMEKLGYAPRYIEWYLQVDKAKRKK